MPKAVQESWIRVPDTSRWTHVNVNFSVQVTVKQQIFLCRTISQISQDSSNFPACKYYLNKEPPLSPNLRNCLRPKFAKFSCHEISCFTVFPLHWSIDHAWNQLRSHFGPKFTRFPGKVKIVEGISVRCFIPS